SARREWTRQCPRRALAVEHPSRHRRHARSRRAGLSEIINTTAMAARPNAPGCPVKAYAITAARLAPSPSAHVTRAGADAFVQKRSEESPASRRGTRRRITSAAADAQSDAMRRTEIAAEGSGAWEKFGRMTKCATSANRTTPVISEACKSRIVFAGA